LFALIFVTYGKQKAWQEEPKKRYLYTYVVVFWPLEGENTRTHGMLAVMEIPLKHAHTHTTYSNVANKGCEDVSQGKQGKEGPKQ